MSMTLFWNVNFPEENQQPMLGLTVFQMKSDFFGRQTTTHFTNED